MVTAVTFAHYNSVRQHKGPKITPAMATGVPDRVLEEW
jgi:hypothetical protein